MKLHPNPWKTSSGCRGRFDLTFALAAPAVGTRYIASAQSVDLLVFVGVDAMYRVPTGGGLCAGE